MSGLNSSADDFIINAVGTAKEIKFQNNGVEVASIDTSGALTSNSIDATKLTGALPAISGASLTGIDTGADTSLSNLSATGEQRVAHAWIYFNGNGTVAINDSHNVSSLTDVGTGNYRVNLSNNMTNATFVGTVTCGGSGSGGSFTYHGTIHSRLVGSYGINTTAYNIGTNLGDTDHNSSIIFGD